MKILLLGMFAFLSGCTLFTNPMGQPVIEAKLNASLFSAAEVGTISLTPERRVVLVNFTNHRFCAEAPTEVGIDMSHLLKIAANASKADIKVGLEAIRAAATSNSVLNKRTQGMQLFLANAYFICQMYMNSAINEAQLMELQLITLNSVTPLIEKEISLMYAVPKSTVSTKTSEQTKYVPIDINKELEELQKK